MAKITNKKLCSKLWFVMRKLLKLILSLLIMVIYLVVAAYILLHVKGYLNRDKKEEYSYFKSYNFTGRILIPEQIVKSENCEEFFKWQYEHLPLVMHGKCPWYVYTELYPVKIGSLDLNIPRKYLLVSSHSERKLPSVGTKSWLYPSMELEGRSLSHKSFWFSIDNFRDDDRYKSTFQKYFWSLLRIDREKGNFEIISLGFDDASQMKKYRFDEKSVTLDPPRTFETFVYTNDDIRDPENFIICGSEREDSTCDSVFKYKDVYIELHFKYYLLGNYKDIKSEIIKLMIEWETKE